MAHYPMVRILSLCAVVLVAVGSPITNPLKSDEDIGQVIPQYFDSKRTKSYHTYSPNTSIPAQEVTFSLEHGTSTEFSLRWSTTVGSPVYATPVIFPSATDGRKQIFLNTFYQYAEMIDSDGYKSWGWPLSFEDSSFQGSPMVYDVDGDGHIDMGLVDKSGNMFWVRIGQAGEYLEDYHVQVPKLKVKRDWAQGLDPTFVDSYVKLSMFDRSDPGQEGAGGAGRGGAMKTARLDDLQAVTTPVKDAAAPQRRRLSEEADGGEASAGEEQQPEGHEQEGDAAERVDMDFGDGATDDFMRLEAERLESGRQMYGEQPEGEAGETGESGESEGQVGDSKGEGEGDAMSGDSSASQAGSDADAPASLEDIMSAGDLDEAAAQATEGQALDGTYEYAYRAAPKRAHGGHRTGYGAGAYYAGAGGEGGLNESQYVMVDAHVLASPVLTDINGDGHMEVLMSVSYYFDKAEYAGSEVDFDPDMYVAGGVACWDLDEQRWTWLVHLDLTTTKSKFQAMIYAPPTVADLDGDGRTEVIVGTAMGLLYVMDGESGFVRRFFPMQFHSIQAQISVADVAGDARLEMIVLDMGGTVAVVDVEGTVLWDAHLSGTLPFPATVGDVDGDGQADVVVVAATANKGSHIYALRGDSGAVLPGYPITLPGNAAVSSPVLLVDLLSARARTRPGSYSAGNASDAAERFEARVRQIPLRKPAMFAGTVDDPFPIDPLGALNERNRAVEKQQKGLHLVLSAHEGSVYIIYGQPTEQPLSLATEQDKQVLAGSDSKAGKATGVTARFHAQRLDVGEHIYSAPLLDDVTGDGYLDLLVGTLNGQLLLFESSLPHHTGNSWTSFPNHRLNSVTHGVMGVAVPFAEKQKLRQCDIKGRSTLNVAFDIWDKHFVEPPATEALPEPADESDARYTVTITRGTNRLQPVWTGSFSRPGRYIASIPVSPPELTLLVVSLRSTHGEYFEDTVHVALSTRFYVWIKYLVCAPIALLSFTLVSRFRKHIV